MIMNDNDNNKNDDQNSINSSKLHKQIYNSTNNHNDTHKYTVHYQNCEFHQQFW